MYTGTVEVNDIIMDYFTFGRGEKTFVILPGVDCKSLIPAARAVRSAYRAFEEDYTVYAFDRRQNMPDPYPIRQMAQDTAAVMQKLGIRDAHIFGASQGGMIAMCIAIDHPELVHALALGSTACRCGDDGENGTDRWVELAKAGDMTGLTADFIEGLYGEETIAKFKDVFLHLNDNVTEEGLRRFIIMVEAINGFDVYEELPKITCPTLVIGCEGDKILPAENSKKIADKLGCQLYLYGKEYGHAVFDEAPDYKRRLLDFFEST